MVPPHKRRGGGVVMKRKLFCFAMSIGFLFAVAAAGLLFAQGTRGTVSGVVLDQSKAVVQKASVKLIDSDKNLTVQNITADEKGEFRFLEVEPANYEVIATAPG